MVFTMAYKFKKFDYYQIDNHYECVVSLYLPKDIEDDIFNLYKMDDNVSIKFLREEDMENDVLNDFKEFLRQNKVEFDIFESGQMEFMLYFDHFNQLNSYIVWEMFINDKNTQNLVVLEGLLNDIIAAHKDKSKSKLAETSVPTTQKFKSSNPGACVLCPRGVSTYGLLYICKMLIGY